MLPIALWVIDPVGKIVFANKAAEHLGGFESGELQGTSIAQYGMSMTDVEELLQKDSSAKIFREIVTRDKDSLQVSMGAARVPELSYIVLSLEQNPDYYQMRDEKQFFESIVRNYPIAVAVQDPEGICRAWNSNMEQLFGLAEQQAVGRPMRELIPAELSSALEILDKEVMQHEQVVLERQMTCKNYSGKELTLSVSKVPILSGSTLTSVLTVFENISSRQAREKELLQTRNLLQAILDHVPLGIYTRTADYEVTYFNNQSLSVLGLMNPKYVTNLHPDQSGEDRKKYVERERQIIAEGVLKDFPNEVFVNEQGQEKILHMIKIPLMQAGPEPLVLTIVEDVTKRREQEREIAAANDFLSAIIENAPVGLYARTEAGEMLLSNKMSEHIFHDEDTQNEKGFL